MRARISTPQQPDIAETTSQLLIRKYESELQLFNVSELDESEIGKNQSICRDAEFRKFEKVFKGGGDISQNQRHISEHTKCDN